MGRHWFNAPVIAVGILENPTLADAVVRNKMMLVFSSTWTTMSKYETTGSLKVLLEFAVDELPLWLRLDRSR